MWKPLLNFDVANTAFHKEQPVIDFMCDILRLRDIRPNIDRRDMMKFEKALKGLKIEPTHRGNGVVRRYKVIWYFLTSKTWIHILIQVMGLSRQNAMQTTFEGENGKTSVAEYFQG